MSKFLSNLDSGHLNINEEEIVVLNSLFNRLDEIGYSKARELNLIYSLPRLSIKKPKKGRAKIVMAGINFKSVAKKDANNQVPVTADKQKSEITVLRRHDDSTLNETKASGLKRVIGICKISALAVLISTTPLAKEATAPQKTPVNIPRQTIDASYQIGDTCSNATKSLEYTVVA